MEKKFSIKSTTLSSDKIIKLLEVIEEQKELKGYEYSSLEIHVELKENTSYRLAGSVELKKIFNDEFELINGLDIRFYSEDLTLYLTTYNDRINLSVNGQNQEQVLFIYDKFRKKLLAHKNYNWVIHNLFIPQVLVALLATSISVVIANAIPGTLQVGVLMLTFFVVYTIFFLVSLKIEKLYPVMLITHKNIKSGRDFGKDIWKICTFILIILVLPIIQNKIS